MKEPHGGGVANTPDPSEEAAAWLGAGPGFLWDAAKQTKNATKHDVSVEEAESMLRNPFVLAGRVIEPAYYEHRWVLLGRTSRGRLLTMVFTRRGGRIRPISCRPMARQERRLYGKAHTN